MGAGGDELQSIPVTRDQECFHTGPLRHAGSRAQYIIRLEALAFAHGDAHGREHLLEQGELGPQILRRNLASRLVFPIEFVAEGGAVHIEGYQQVGGLPFHEL